MDTMDTKIITYKPVKFVLPFHNFTGISYIILYLTNYEKPNEILIFRADPAPVRVDAFYDISYLNKKLRNLSRKCWSHFVLQGYVAYECDK